MKTTLRNLLCLTPFVAFLGCGGTPEEKPPEKAPEMSAEEKKNMEDQVNKMRGDYKAP